MKRRLAVIFMADMVDYSRLMEADQQGTIELIRELRERWLEPEAVQRGGEVLKRMGDGWIIAFTSVTDAVETAQAVQKALAGHARIKLRIAAHLGEIAEDGTDLYGTGINITARLQTEAPPGGVMISQDLHRQLDARLAEGFADAGAFTLKNIAHPVTGYQWRPARTGNTRLDEVPLIGVEPVVAAPDTVEARDAAADLTEQSVHRLSLRTGIRVLALDGSEEDKASKPTYVLRGRLRVRPNAASASMTLVLRETGQVAWSAVYDGAPDDLYGLCDLAAGRLDTDLRRVINAHDGERLSGVRDEDLSAAELRVRASQLFYATTIESYEHAVRLMDRGLILAPQNAMCLAMWVHARVILSQARFADMDTETAALVTARIDEAVQLAPRSDYAFATRASVRLMITGDLDGARRDLARSEQINPGYHFSALWFAMLAAAEGNFTEDGNRLAEIYPTLENEPFRPIFAYALAVCALLDRRPDDAMAYMVDAIELRPSCRAYRLLAAEALAQKGADAREADMREAAARLPATPDLLAPRLRLPAEHAWLMDLLAPSRDG